MTQVFYDAESERILLCQMILDNKIIPEVSSRLKATSFYSAVSQKCFSLITEMFAKGLRVDECLFRTEFSSIPNEFKNAVLESTFTASNWKFYADKVGDCFIARNCNRIMLAGSSEVRPENARAKAMEIVTELNEVLMNNIRPSIFTYAEMIPAYLEKLNERLSNRSVSFGTQTGFDTLDALFGGGFPDEYALISARPSIGKTALALQLANRFSLRRRVLFIEFEMSENSIMERTVMSEARLDGKKLRCGFMTEAEYGSLNNCFSRLFDNKNMVFAFPRERSVESLVSLIRAQVMSQGIGAVFIDQMSFITAGGMRTRWESQAEVSKCLQSLQKELRIPFIVLAQQNREAESKAGGLATIAGTDAIGQDADIVMILERQRQKSETEFCIPTKLHVEKSRNSACGDIYLNFFPRYAVFETDPNPTAEEEPKEKK